MIWIAFGMKSDPCKEMDFINENPVCYTLYLFGDKEDKNCFISY